MKILFLRLTFIAILIFTALGFSSCENSGEAHLPEPAPSAETVELAVKAFPVQRIDWIHTVPVSGSLRTRSIVDVKPEVGGRLLNTLVQEGDRVQKGQLLAEIEDVNYRLAYEQSAAAMKVAQAGLKRTKVSAEYAKTEKERADNLLRSGGITEKDHQAAVTGLKEAESQVGLSEAQILQAEAALAIAEKALNDCRVFAPAGGVVQKRWLDEGSLLSPGVSVFTLVDNSRLELECVIPSYHLASVKNGQPAEFTTPSYGERIFKGVVSAVSPTIQSENRSVKITLKVENRGMELRSGMYARGSITTGIEKGVLVIPRDALIPEEEVSVYGSVFVFQDGKAKLRRVLVGGDAQDRVWIREGLREGERVIVERGPALKDETPVRTVNDTTESGR